MKQRRRRRWRLRIVPVWVRLAGIGLVLCVGCGRHASQDGATRDTPPTWTCRLGTQGGFTGGGDGFVVHSDGRVLSWSRATADSDVDTRSLGSADPRHLATLRAALEAPELATIVWRKSGNMTTFLEILRQDERQRWSWPAGRPGTGTGTGTEKVPPAVRRCYDAARSAARHAVPTP